MISRFSNEYRYLSNFHRVTVEFEGLLYTSVEHAYQAAKSLDPDVRLVVANAATSAAAKAVGRALNLRPDWEDVKIEIMRELLAKKFQSGTLLAGQLIQTYPYELVEGNTWGDRFWGVCRGEGENWLGLLLMDRRDTLMEQRD